MFKIKVLGAGSIGNHLSNASRAMGWDVDLCDIDAAALERTRTQIYPSRYGQWDEGIRLFESKDAPKGGYDLIFIGTPPDWHVPLALEAVKEKPRAILVEKPFCTPDMKDAQALFDAAAAAGVAVFTGYDHVVGKASETFSEIVTSGRLGTVETLDVEFREFWGGIFSAHPWLSGPGDTYLGYWKRGGGASGEHSHAINLWQHFAHEIGAGRVTQVQASMDFVSDGHVDYDKLCLLHLTTESGLVGRVVQDVVTNPPRKWARLQASNGYAEWQCGFKPGVDAVFEGGAQGQSAEHLFAKTRPDDFIQELRHIEAALSSDPTESSLSIACGLETMLVVAAAHKSVHENRTVTIDYTAGYTEAALK
ncbi:MAG: Gfo/Idh/MocA family oxidoreductase [Rhodospirillaceae bacterium]|nr:Gfo/Idh/MocA family oxidoreductase [Rhodospirillaceae bacterium]